MDLLDQLLVEVLGRRGLRHLVRLGVHVELHFVAGDARLAFGQLRQIELDQRQRLGLVVAEDRGVNLAAIDVLLDQRGGAELVVDVLDALHQVLDRVHDRFRVDAFRRVFRRRLHDQRELDVLRVLDLSFVDHRRGRGIDVVEAHDLLGHRLLHGQVRRVRPGAGVFFPDQIEKRGEVHLLGVVAGVRLGEVEEEVSVLARDLGQRGRLTVDGDLERLVPQLGQRLGDRLAVGERLLLLAAAARRRCRLGVLARIRLGAFPAVEDDRDFHSVADGVR